MLSSSSRSLMIETQRLMSGSKTPGYVYTYPHKKAFRVGDLDITSLWPKSETEINIYVHIPFCKHRCSYCNLFTLPLRGVNAGAYVEVYVGAVVRQIQYYAELLGDRKVLSLYFGGGTPNFLTTQQLSRIMEAIQRFFPNWVDDIEPAIECSPALLNEGYIMELRRLGFRRVSMGVQSFREEVLKSMNRNSDVLGIHEVYRILKQLEFNVNLDIIYGLNGQNEEAILHDISAALSLDPKPDNLSLYPLVVRELTKLYQLQQEGDSIQFDGDIYQLVGRTLAKNGYVQRSSVRAELISSASSYSQQVLEFRGYPTVGIGAGARSYTEECHYSLAYGINPKLTKKIISQFIGADFHEQTEFDAFIFNGDELRRKFVIYGLLSHRLDTMKYRQKFQESIEEYFDEEISVLVALKLITLKGDFYIFTDYGRRYSDIVVQMFFSREVQRLERSYQLS